MVHETTDGDELLKDREVFAGHAVEQRVLGVTVLQNKQIQRMNTEPSYPPLRNQEHHLKITLIISKLAVKNLTRN